MTPELSRRIAKVATMLRQILSIDDYDALINAAKQASTFEKLSDWHKFLIERAEAS